jgi:hypothetical protein
VGILAADLALRIERVQITIYYNNILISLINFFKQEFLIMKAKPHSMHKSTKAIHTGSLKESVFGEVSVPIFQSSTFSFPREERGQENNS